MPLQKIRDSFLTYLQQQNRLQGNPTYPAEWLEEQSNDFFRAMQYTEQQWAPLKQQLSNGDFIKNLFIGVHQRIALKAYRIKLDAQHGALLGKEMPGEFRQCALFSPKQIPMIDSSNDADLCFLQHGRMPQILDVRLQRKGIKPGNLTFTAKARNMNGELAWPDANSVIQIAAYIHTHNNPLMSYYFLCGYYKEFFLNAKRVLNEKDQLFSTALKGEINTLGQILGLPVNPLVATLDANEQKAIELAYTFFLPPEKISEAFSRFLNSLTSAMTKLDVTDKAAVAEFCFDSFQSYIDIHPFLDANYRTFGVVMNGYLSSIGYSLINFHDLKLKRALARAFGEETPNKPAALHLLKACLALEKIGQPLFQSEDLGKTLRTAAAQGNVAKIVELLDEHPAIVNSVASSQKRTALHWAFDKEQSDCAMSLLQRGAQYDLQDTNLQTPVDIGLNKNNAGINATLTQYFLSKYDSAGRNVNKALRTAANAGDLAAVKFFIETGVSINAAGPETGQTALHRAVIKKHALIVEYLVGKNADSSIEDKEGYSSVYYAHGDANLLAYLDRPQIELVSPISTLMS